MVNANDENYIVKYPELKSAQSNFDLQIFMFQV